MKRSTVIAFLGLIALNASVVAAQWFLSSWRWYRAGCDVNLLPEARYLVQSLILLLPAVPMLLLKWRHGQKALALGAVLMAVTAAVYLVKAQVPGTRRHQYVSACQWAVEEIRRDYRGPVVDAEILFSDSEYCTRGRPVVEAHIARVPYLLDGRAASAVGCSVQHIPDGVIPDYIVDETGKAVDESGAVKSVWSVVAKGKYVKLAERRFGKRDFVILKRVR